MNSLMARCVAAWEDDGGSGGVPPSASPVRRRNQDQVSTSTEGEAAFLDVKPGDRILHGKYSGRRKGKLGRGLGLMRQDDVPETVATESLKLFVAEGKHE